MTNGDQFDNANAPPNTFDQKIYYMNKQYEILGQVQLYLFIFYYLFTTALIGYMTYKSPTWRTAVIGIVLFTFPFYIDYCVLLIKAIYNYILSLIYGTVYIMPSY